MQRTDLPPMPARIMALKRNDKGYPVPWFVWLDKDGVPDFRVVDTPKIGKAVRQRRCWICGGTLGRNLAFILGPMCCVNRINSEPPSHLECAQFAVRACPFLSHPLAKRDERTEVNGPTVSAPGHMLARNPGCSAIWVTDRYKPFKAPHGGEGYLFELGAPSHVEWWANGRAATRFEVEDSLNTGLPSLYELCHKDANPAASRAMLDQRVRELAPWLPTPEAA